MTDNVPRLFVWQRAFRDSKLLGLSGVSATTVKAAGLVLATYASADGGSIHPGNARLAENLNASDKTIKRCLKALRDAGWITPVGGSNSFAGVAQTYQLTFPRDEPSRAQPISAKSGLPQPLLPKAQRTAAAASGSSSRSGGQSANTKGTPKTPSHTAEEGLLPREADYGTPTTPQQASNTGKPGSRLDPSIPTGMEGEPDEPEHSSRSGYTAVSRRRRGLSPDEASPRSRYIDSLRHSR